MNTKQASVSKQGERLELLKQFKVQAGQNNLLGAAIAAQKLHKKTGMSPDEIITSLNKMNCKVSKPHIYNHFKLAGVPPVVKAYIRSGKIKPTEVLNLIHKHQEPTELIRLVEKAIAKNEIENEKKQQKLKQKNESEIITKLIAKTERAAKRLGINDENIKKLNQAIVKLTGNPEKTLQASA